MFLCLVWCSCSCIQQPLFGCRLLPLWCCLLTLANNRSLVPQCLSASCGALALAANSRSLVVGCCCCCASLACSHRQSACSQQPLIGCRLLLLLCFSGLQPQACFLFFFIINNRSLVRASLSLCLVWCSCSCSHQPLIGCRLLLLLCFSCLQPQAKRLQPTAAHWL